MGQLTDQIQNTNNIIETQKRDAETRRKTLKNYENYLYKYFKKEFQREIKHDSNDLAIYTQQDLEQVLHILQDLEIINKTIDEYIAKNAIINDFYNNYDLITIYKKVLNNTYKLYIDNYNREIDAVKGFTLDNIKVLTPEEEEEADRLSREKFQATAARLQKEERKRTLKAIAKAAPITILKILFWCTIGGIYLIFKFIAELANNKK